MLCTYVRMANLMARLRSDERGVTAVEYGLMAAAVAAAVAVAAIALGTKVSGVFTSVTNAMPS